MRVVVQIPCLNEQETLPTVLAGIPTEIPGIDPIDVVVIDDGSTDATARIAREHGAHVITHSQRMGLAQSFRDGVEYALSTGADIVVNTDGDNQYPQDRIPDLIAPIVDRRAEIVIGDRQTATIAHFSPAKKAFQRLGSWVVNRAAGTHLPDAASGFRAYSREALLRLNVITTFSYTMETIIQAGNKRIPIASVPVTTNAKTRESRLFKHPAEHVARSARAIVRSYLMFRPWVVFGMLTAVFGVIGLIPFVRFLVLRALGNDGDHFQSLLLGTLLLVGALLSLALGVLSDLLRTNRQLHEQSLEHLKAMRFARGGDGR